MSSPVSSFRIYLNNERFYPLIEKKFSLKKCHLKFLENKFFRKILSYLPITDMIKLKLVSKTFKRLYYLIEKENSTLKKELSLKKSRLKFLEDKNFQEILSYLPITDMIESKLVCKTFIRECSSTPEKLCTPLTIQLKSIRTGTAQNPSIMGTEIVDLITRLVRNKTDSIEVIKRNYEIAAQTLAKAYLSSTIFSIDLSRPDENELLTIFIPFITKHFQLKIFNISFRQKTLDLSTIFWTPLLTHLFITGDIKIKGSFSRPFPDLQYLDVTGCTQFSDENIINLNKLNLKYLNLTLCHRITILIMSFPYIHILNLNNCAGITDKGIEPIKELNTLVALDISNCIKLTDKTLFAIKNLTRLTFFSISNCTEMTDAGLMHIKNLVDLTTLDIKGCNFTHLGMGVLKNFSKLTVLDARNSLVNDSCLDILARDVKSLEKLYLGNSNIFTNHYSGIPNMPGITNFGMCHLITMPKLQHLIVRSFKVNDDGLEILKALKAIKSLDLKGCNITGPALIRLKTNPNFKGVELKPNPEEFLDSQINQLDQLPSCVIS